MNGSRNQESEQEERLEKSPLPESYLLGAPEAVFGHSFPEENPEDAAVLVKQFLSV
jgi:hypothetical protein